MNHINDMTKGIAEVDNIIDGQMRDYEEAIAKLEEIPGIAKRSAKVILAEIGLEMRRFQQRDTWLHAHIFNPEFCR